MNEESSNTTFRNHTGTSNIDFTIISTQLLSSVSGWVISDQESISDHSIIKYAIGHGTGQWNADNIREVRYITKESLAKFQGNILQIVKTKLGKNHDIEVEDLDDTLSSLLTEETDTETRIDEFSEALKLACNTSFQTHRATEKTTVPWWTEELTMLRKRTNAQRRLYQRTRNNDELRDTRKQKTRQVKQRMQQPSKLKKSDPGKSTAT
jgi:hypothetical protein